MAAFITYPFEPEGLFQGHGYSAARRAVLWPVVLPALKAAARQAGTKFEKPGLAVAHQTLHDVWRSRIKKLASAGWSPVRADADADPKADGTRSANYRFVCVANCPPFAARTRRGQKGHECHRSRVCPMCYARRVVIELYKATAYAFFPDDEGRRHQRVGIAACRRTFDVGLSERGADGWLLEANRLRFADADRVPTARGSAVLTTFEPLQGQPGRIRIVRSTLLLVPQAIDLDPLRVKGDVMAVEPAEVTKKSIGQVVSWAAKYPLGMMYGDAPIAVALYEAAAAKRAKMFTTAGLLRNNQARTPARAADASQLD